MIAASVQGTARHAAGAWRRFFFAPEPASTMALVRIGFGAIVTLWSITLLPDIGALLGRDAIIGPVHRGQYAWTLLDSSSPTWLAWTLALVTLAGGLALIAGWHTRLASLIVLVSLVSLERRNPYAFNSGDLLLRHLAFFMTLMPAGEAFSLDHRRRGTGLWPVPMRAPWALRLLQIQLSIGYAASVWAKLRGDTWHDGTALWYALRIDDLLRFGTPPGAGSLVLVNLMTYGVLALELALAIGLWLPRWRWPLLIAGTVMHLFIDLTLMVGFFSYAIFVCYLAFVPPAVATRWLVRAGLLARRQMPNRAPSS